jgi:hypothetical protein
VIIGRYERTLDDLKDRLDRLFDRRMYLKLPKETANLFYPIALFDADLHCVRAKEIEEMKSILDLIEERCIECEALNMDDSSLNTDINSSMTQMP